MLLPCQRSCMAGRQKRPVDKRLSSTAALGFPKLEGKILAGSESMGTGSPQLQIQSCQFRAESKSHFRNSWGPALMFLHPAVLLHLRGYLVLLSLTLLWAQVPTEESELQSGMYILQPLKMVSGQALLPSDLLSPHLKDIGVDGFRS